MVDSNEMAQWAAQLASVERIVECIRRRITEATPKAPSVPLAPTIPEDTRDLVAAIATAVIEASRGRDSHQITAMEVMGRQEAYQAYGAALETYGIAMVEDRPGHRRPYLSQKKIVAIDAKRLKRRLLIQSARWRQIDTDAVANALLALAGAKRSQRTIGRHRVWGIDVPIGSWATAAEGAEEVPLARGA